MPCCSYTTLFACYYLVCKLLGDINTLIRTPIIRDYDLIRDVGILLFYGTKRRFKVIGFIQGWDYNRKFWRHRLLDTICDHYIYKWTRRDSNPRPLRCERNDLPLIYRPGNIYRSYILPSSTTDTLSTPLTLLKASSTFSVPPSISPTFTTAIRAFRPNATGFSEKVCNRAPFGMTFFRDSLRPSRSISMLSGIIFIFAATSPILFTVPGT